jgi:lipopolysaccharide/colanic/teichoic acid biosynthesis glycosyltransferase
MAFVMPISGHRPRASEITPGARRWGETGLRVVNIIVATAALILLAPVFVVFGALVFFQDGGPIFFSHGRVGLRGRLFACLKLRTMAADADARLATLLAADETAREEWARDHKLRADPRVTALGRFLRKTSIDELPQLINVLRGEMNLVGPRPVTPDEIARYGKHAHYYRSVKPGITGLWQVSGRNDVSYRRRVVMDCLYARRRNPLFDLKILFATIPAVLLRRGTY